jgi:hypothetical protein
MKKGGKGHKTQNWKKRYFVLQGQFLNYFDRANAVSYRFSAHNRFLTKFYF